MWMGYKSVFVVLGGWLETDGFYLWNKYVRNLFVLKNERMTEF